MNENEGVQSLREYFGLKENSNKLTQIARIWIKTRRFSGVYKNALRDILLYNMVGCNDPGFYEIYLEIPEIDPYSAVTDWVQISNTSDVLNEVYFAGNEECKDSYRELGCEKDSFEYFFVSALEITDNNGTYYFYDYPASYFLKNVGTKEDNGFMRRAQQEIDKPIERDEEFWEILCNGIPVAENPTKVIISLKNAIPEEYEALQNCLIPKLALALEKSENSFTLANLLKTDAPEIFIKIRAQYPNLKMDDLSQAGQWNL